MKVHIFTREEMKLLRKLKSERSWDPDMRALIGMVEAAQVRLDEGLSQLHVLEWVGQIFKRAHVACIFFDVAGNTGKVAVTRRTGLMGVGPDLHTAFNDMQVLDPRPLDRRGISDPENRSKNENENTNESQGEDKDAT